MFNHRDAPRYQYACREGKRDDGADFRCAAILALCRNNV
jgi:hypothetical protein